MKLETLLNKIDENPTCIKLNKLLQTKIDAIKPHHKAFYERFFKRRIAQKNFDNDMKKLELLVTNYKLEYDGEIRILKDKINKHLGGFGENDHIV